MTKQLKVMPNFFIKKETYCCLLLQDLTFSSLLGAVLCCLFFTKRISFPNMLCVSFAKDPWSPWLFCGFAFLLFSPVYASLTSPWPLFAHPLLFIADHPYNDSSLRNHPDMYSGESQW